MTQLCATREEVAGKRGLRDPVAIRKSLIPNTKRDKAISSLNPRSRPERRLKTFSTMRTCWAILIFRRWEMRCKSMARKKNLGSWRKRLISSKS
jgi:hypothetical protein